MGYILMGRFVTVYDHYTLWTFEVPPTPMSCYMFPIKFLYTRGGSTVIIGFRVGMRTICLGP